MPVGALTQHFLRFIDKRAGLQYFLPRRAKGGGGVGNRIRVVAPWQRNGVLCAAALSVLLIQLGSARDSLAQSCTVPAFGMEAWWRGEGNANDFFGGHNGVLTNGATTAPSKVG